ncbi:hypothetical protein [Blastopirellula marina]|uniref:Uncharacterized protein n=1 Tax=Blastopirellula marina DSM 3645 TaxID=314230 RepID=A4A150_9BACT|nr:hypothetical protein [Blastopirellula marina]EAQ77510.1 hypothetical protein DSM3645_06604 [Blastopirellula marina DSM 3645]
MKIAAEPLSPSLGSNSCAVDAPIVVAIYRRTKTPAMLIPLIWPLSLAQ